MTTSQPVVTCASCGAPINGRFCGQCGSPAGPRQCDSCAAPLTPGARFCHLCGTRAVGGPAARNERATWTVVGTLVILSAIGVAFLLNRDRTPARAPDMGNAGNAVPGQSGARPPDISQMGPRERFDRLFNRIAGSQSPDTVAMFAPMALSAYQQLDQFDTDARFHAAIIHLVVQEFAEAKALADTIATAEPTHLFPFLLRGEAAEQQNDTAALAKSYAGFLANFDAEMKTRRKEYLEHQTWLDEFKTKAQANQK